MTEKKYTKYPLLFLSFAVGHCNKEKKIFQHVLPIFFSLPFYLPLRIQRLKVCFSFFLLAIESIPEILSVHLEVQTRMVPVALLTPRS